jgi:hypothetical protein
LKLNKLIESLRAIELYAERRRLEGNPVPDSMIEEETRGLLHSALLYDNNRRERERGDMM